MCKVNSQNADTQWRSKVWWFPKFYFMKEDNNSSMLKWIKQFTLVYKKSQEASMGGEYIWPQPKVECKDWQRLYKLDLKFCNLCASIFNLKFWWWVLKPRILDFAVAIKRLNLFYLNKNRYHFLKDLCISINFFFYITLQNENFQINMFLYKRCHFHNLKKINYSPF